MSGTDHPEGKTNSQVGGLGAWPTTRVPRRMGKEYGSELELIFDSGKATYKWPIIEKTGRWREDNWWEIRRFGLHSQSHVASTVFYVEATTNGG